MMSALERIMSFDTDIILPDCWWPMHEASLADAWVFQHD